MLLKWWSMSSSLMFVWIRPGVDAYNVPSLYLGNYAFFNTPCKPIIPQFSHPWLHARKDQTSPPPPKKKMQFFSPSRHGAQNLHLCPGYVVSMLIKNGDNVCRGRDPEEKDNQTLYIFDDVLAASTWNKTHHQNPFQHASILLNERGPLDPCSVHIGVETTGT